MTTYHYVVDDTQFLEKSDVLECSCYPKSADFISRSTCDLFSLEEDFSACRSIETCNVVEKCGLSCTIRSDKSSDHILFNEEIDFVYSDDTAELSSESLCFKHAHFQPPSSIPSKPSRLPYCFFPFFQGYLEAYKSS